MCIFSIYYICNWKVICYNWFKLIFNKKIMEDINIDNFKKEGFSFEEIEWIKRGLDDVEKGRTISFNDVKLKARKKIFSNNKSYV